MFLTWCSIIDTDTPVLLSTLPALCSTSPATAAMPAWRDTRTSSWLSRLTSASARLRAVMSRLNTVTPVTSPWAASGCIVVSRCGPSWLAGGGSSKPIGPAPASTRSMCGRQRAHCAGSRISDSATSGRGARAPSAPTMPSNAQLCTCSRNPRSIEQIAAVALSISASSCCSSRSLVASASTSSACVRCCAASYRYPITPTSAMASTATSTRMLESQGASPMGNVAPAR
ncbi:MAG TPA: hypothetical protein VNM90_03390 [Haliangium sp.]|nr:hypothetical protein [Haliangium sp.]